MQFKTIATFLAAFAATNVLAAPVANAVADAAPEVLFTLIKYAIAFTNQMPQAVPCPSCGPTPKGYVYYPKNYIQTNYPSFTNALYSYGGSNDVHYSKDSFSVLGLELFSTDSLDVDKSSYYDVLAFYG